jgi:hypothetical protein
MALMGFRESNQVKWVGVRPAHRGEQVVKSSSAQNATVIIHTVTAGKTLFLCSVFLRAYWNVVGNSHPLAVRNAADVIQYTLLDMLAPAVGHGEVSRAFGPPLEIPAGYDITIVSAGVGDIMLGSIFGWEE